MDFVCLFLFADVEYDSEADELGSSESSHNCRRAGGFLREELLAFVAKFSDPEEVEGFELLVDIPRDGPVLGSRMVAFAVSPEND